MAGEEILVNYEELNKIIDFFSLEAEKLEQLVSTLTQHVEILHGCGFKGKASDTFHVEMESLVFPGLKRLEDAMWFGQKSLQEIVQVFQKAEDEAVNGVNFSEEEPAYQNFVKDAFVDYFKSLKRSINELKFKRNWRNANQKQKLAMLNEFQNMLSNEYNIPPIPVSVEELEDSGDNDYRGRYSRESKTINIDIENFENDNPVKIFETMAHESRHAMQHYYVEHPDQAHPFINSEQLINWEENFENYISGSDDFEGYWKQPIEADARQFATIIMDDFLEEGKGLNAILD
ncbi:MAG: hypothetical protein CL609_10700 [Anaerolineaceae bacterium]|nr:hypothetical protein [Anaerolineaceae bacterium]